MLTLLEQTPQLSIGVARDRQLQLLEGFYALLNHLKLYQRRKVAGRVVMSSILSSCTWGQV